MFWVALLPLLLSSADSAYFLDDRLSAPPQHSLLDRPFFYPQVPDLFGYSGFLEPYYHQPQPPFYHHVSTALTPTLSFWWNVLCIVFSYLARLKLMIVTKLAGKYEKDSFEHVQSYFLIQRYSFKHKYCFWSMFIKAARVLVLVCSLLIQE